MCKIIIERISLYWKLIKSLQTGLLLATGLAGFMSFKCPVFNIPLLTEIAVSLFLSISGSTVLNMWYDRDIDAKMKRTCYRPLASGIVSSREVLNLGVILSILGVGFALLINPLYGLIVFLGIFFDVLIYTIWLKRRTCWSIIWGGLAGGMPILAGRTLAVGYIDWVGLLLAIGILFWIPTHIMTFSMRYYDDYQAAGIPTFPSRYSFSFTRLMIAISSVLTAVTIGLAAIGIGMTIGYLRLLIVLSFGLIFLAMMSLIRPSQKLNFGLFKYASLYMLSAMVLMVV
ncbi:MAG: protoheme IX farnesyltransferase [Chloroflexi bacterium HGW-Chloroflexi-2]|jgi:protoheme IX farnesyltransferase|nr:MAG: protoheme IX farnesyltransferase [Chloroflexi bacterium HGW-Chloroflexi-2]